MVVAQHTERYEGLGCCWRQIIFPIRRWIIQARLTRRVAQGMTANLDDVANRFRRLDVLDLGALDDTKTQLLLSWAFDIDMAQSDWDIIFYYLAGPDSALAKQEAIMDWVESILSKPAEQHTSLASCMHSLMESIHAFGDHLSNQHFIIPHQGRFARLWRVVMFLTVLYMFISVPYMIAFLRYALLTKYFTSLLISWSFDVILFLDIIVKLNMSYEDERSLEVRPHEST